MQYDTNNIKNINNDSSIDNSDNRNNINGFDYIAETKIQLSIWQKYIDALTQRAEASNFVFTSHHIKINKNFTIDIYIHTFNSAIPLNKLNGCEISIMYDINDLAENNENSEDFEGFYYISDDFIDDINSGEVNFDYIDKIGTLIKVKSDKCITVQLYPQYESKLRNGHFVVPVDFFGKISNIGDIVQYKRLQFGISQLSRQLGKSDIYRSLLFCRNKDIVANLPTINMSLFGIDTFLSSSLNCQQKRAVQMAISTENSISLIQGPPGTGKTTVIAEICYQNAIRGRKTLIASQSNLAIDNAMSRLIYSKEILPLREGNVSRIDEIGEKYIPSNIVKTLMDGAVLACKNKIHENKDTSTDINEIKSILNNINDFYNTCFDYYVALLTDAYYYTLNFLIDACYRQIIADRLFTEYDECERMLNTIDKNISSQEKSASTNYFGYLTTVNTLLKQLSDSAPQCCFIIGAEVCEKRLTEYQNIYVILKDFSDYQKELILNKPLFVNFTKLKRWKAAITAHYNNLIELKNVLINSQQQLLGTASFNKKKEELKRKKLYTRIIFAIATYISKSEYINLYNSFKKQQMIVNKASFVLNYLIERETAIYNRPNKSPISSVSVLFDISALINDTFRKIEYIYKSCFSSISHDEYKSLKRQIVSIILSYKESILFNRYDIYKYSDYDKNNYGLNYDKYSISVFNKIINDRKNLAKTIFGIYKISNLHAFEVYALDNVSKLEKETIRRKNINNILTKWCDSIKSFDNKMTDDLFNIIMQNVNVVSITCLQSAGKSFKEKYKNTIFDTVVIDEVSKSIPPELILPSTLGKSLVLIGDHKQLPPMIDNQTLDEIDPELRDSLETSVFKTLFENIEPSHKTMLTVQYRMHSQIMNVINCFYDGSLICGLSHEEEEIRKNHFVSGKYISLDKHAIWINVPNHNRFYEEKDNTSIFNNSEISAILTVLKDINNGLLIDTTTVSVISFYGAQVIRIKEQVKNSSYPKLKIKISTVDRFQGAESEIVIVSTVRNNSYGDIGFAKSFERINVAFSRAQKLLIIIGSSEMLTTNKNKKSSNVYQNIYKLIDNHGGVIPFERLL